MFNADNAKAQSRTAAKWSDGHYCMWCGYPVTSLHLLVFNNLGDFDPLHCNPCNLTKSAPLPNLVAGMLNACANTLHHCRVLLLKNIERGSWAGGFQQVHARGDWEGETPNPFGVLPT